MKILAIAGSNSETSINRDLVAYAAELTGQQVTVIDMLAYDELPLYSAARQQRDGFPPAIQALYELIQAHDGVMIASPEHNGSLPAAFKNVIDWLSRINMKWLGGKPVVAMSTSPGPNGGQTNLNHLASLLPWWGANLIGTYSLGNFFQQMDRASGTLAAAEQERLMPIVTEFNAALTPQPVLQAA